MKILKNTIKYSFIILLIAIFALIFTRIYIFSYYPKLMKSFIWNNAVESALGNETTGEVFTYKPPTAYDNAKSSNFFCDYIMIVPKAGQLQITVRANKSLMPKFAEVFELDSIPEYHDITFDFSLVDNDGNHYPLSFKKQDSAYMYYYERLVFDEIPFDDIDSLYLEIYTGENPDYSDNPFTSLYVYDKQVPRKDYKLSKSERTMPES
ncbi:MAG: hypothetical protein GX303_02015 [Clostridiales bacterium]|nr:hypothetical protein [Clostridiales bacterium]